MRAFRPRPRHDDGASRRSMICPTGAPGEELRRFAYVHLCAGSMEMIGARLFRRRLRVCIPAEPVHRRRPADSDRSVRARRLASTCCGFRCARCRRRSRGDAAGEITATDWDEVEGGRYADRVDRASSSAMRRASRAHILGRAVFLAQGSRARESQSDRRRQPRRAAITSTSSFMLPPDRRLVALSHAARGFVSRRRRHLARRGRGRGVRLPARPCACRRTHRGRSLRPARGGRGRLDRHQQACARGASHFIGASPFGGQYEKRFPIGAAEHAGESSRGRNRTLCKLWPPSRTRLHRASGTSAYQTRAFRIEAEPIGNAVAEIGPYPAVGKVAVGFDIEGGEAACRRIRRRSKSALSGVTIIPSGRRRHRRPAAPIRRDARSAMTPGAKSSPASDIESRRH